MIYNNWLKQDKSVAMKQKSVWRYIQALQYNLECPSLEYTWKCTRDQASAQFVHSMCTNMDSPCTLELYTCLGTGLATCVYSQAVSKLGHSSEGC